MPRLSDSMEEGTIVNWLKTDGDQVARGEELVEIETDKATVVYSADDAGTLSILAAGETVVPVGQVIARLDSGPATAAEADTHAVAETPVDQQPPPSASRKGDDPNTPPISPIARRLADRLAVDLTTVHGSGPRGRILKADVEAAARKPSAHPVAPPLESATEAAPGPDQAPVQPLTRTQRLIAERMIEATSSVPTFNVSTDVDMERAVELRAELKATRAADDATPTYNDMIVKAAAIALREFPRVNGSYREDGFVLHDRANVGIAVAAKESLLVPTIFDADRSSLTSIASTSRDLAARVRAATVTPAELTGGTFTVSNLGMLGVTEFTAVINVPQAAILAVGRLGRRAIERDGLLGARTMLTLNLTCDHRIIYGADGAEFLARIKELLERPVALLA